MPATDMIEAYDALAPLYDEYSKKRQAYLDAVDNLVIKHMKPEMRVLDVGAGDGRRLLKIRDAVGIKDFAAVEPSAEMAKILEQKTGKPAYQIFAENLDELDIGQFDVVLALWNVFGHIVPSNTRLKALQNISKKLKPGGLLILDINNRHNAAAYGVFEVIKRRLVDYVDFREERGDASYDWQIGDKTFKGRGHLFTPKEIENLFKNAGLQIVNRYSLNYATGDISKSKYCGQLFYILTGQ